MNFDLPTPGQVLKGIGGMLKSILFALVLLVIFMPFVQIGIGIVGLIFVIFHHWIIGGVLGGIALVAASARKSLN